MAALGGCLMALSVPQVVVDGKPLSTIAAGWGDLKITHRWPGGCWEMSWSVPVRRLRRHEALKARKVVRAFYGGVPIWSGFMAEPNWDTGEMVALGFVRQGEEAICFDSGGLLSSTPDAVVDQAILRGALTWVRRASISSAAFAASGSTDKFNYVTALLDAYTKQANLGWGVNARGEVYTAATATTPSWTVAPDSGVLGVADQTLAASVFGRYLVTGTTIGTASVGSGVPEVAFDLTSYGVKTLTEAQGILTGLRDQMQARTAWTNGLELTAPQITTPGGARANLASIQGNQMVRLQGVRDERGLDAGTNFVIGESIWDVSDRTITINPMGLVDRSLSGIAEDAGVTAL
jgi:hypothetical protein